MHDNGLPNLPKDATKEQIEDEIHRMFRSTFSTEDGKNCLNFILSDLFYFDVCNSENEKTLCNYGKFLVNERLGIKDTIAITDFMIDSVNNVANKEK